jgi:hypothetical protein
MYRHLARILPDAEIVLQKVDKPQAKRIVLLLGFGGGSRRFLKSFADFHNADMGVSTVAFTMPLMAPGFMRNMFEDELARTLHAERLRQGPDVGITVHSFSNNGAWVLGSLQRRGLLGPVQEVVIDSAPQFWYEKMPISREVQVYSSIATSVLASSRGKPPVYWSPFITPLLWVPLLVSTTINRTLLALQTWLLPASLKEVLVSDVVGMNVYLRDNWPTQPCMFMYSAGDKLVTPPEVKEFIEVQRGYRVARGEDLASVREELFDNPDIAHVGLWRGDREHYKEALRSFLLPKWVGNSSKISQSK